MRQKYTILLLLHMIITHHSSGQDEIVPTPRPLTMEEFDKAKTFDVKDPDNESYVKIEGKYILDRYEMRKPYFITGDDGLKKRIDLYKLISKEGMQELGMMIFYTTENGIRYKVCMPNFTANREVWAKYFEDIHAIDKKENNFVLKLSYVLSKEMEFQLYKALNQGKDLKGESATYGNDICFPGDQRVTLADGLSKNLKDVTKGDRLIAMDASGEPSISEVTELVEHEAKSYAITRVIAIAAFENETSLGIHVTLLANVLKATPNHPINTISGVKTFGELKEGDLISSFHSGHKGNDLYTIVSKEEIMEGTQKVYNIITKKGGTFIMNDIVVKQK